MWEPLSTFDGNAEAPGLVISVAAEANADGRIDLFALNSVGDVWLRYQLAPDGAWSGWQPMPPAMMAVPVPVPNVVGMVQAQADQYLQTHAGYFHVGNVIEVLTPDPNKNYRVISQTPAPGTPAAVGSAVDVRVGKPKPPGGF
jgi:hypothetical protein